MGLGGYLMWTASFHEMHKLTGKRVLPVERHGDRFKLIASQVFKNNPSIVDVECESHQGDHIVIPMNLQETNYCKLDTPQYAKHRYDKHIIEQVLEYYNVPSTLNDVQCRLYLTSDEEREVSDVTSSLKDDFITIEPHSNNEYTCNRQYPFEKWQSIVDCLSIYVQVVQVGMRGNKVLKNVVDLTGKTTFRTSAGVIGKSLLFLSTEGGLVHAAQAMKTKSVVVITGYEHPKMVAYPQNTNIWVHGDHGPCGNKQFCQQCWDEVSKHSEQEIVNAVVKEIS